MLMTCDDLMTSSFSSEKLRCVDILINIDVTKKLSLIVPLRCQQEVVVMYCRSVGITTSDSLHGLPAQDIAD